MDNIDINFATVPYNNRQQVLNKYISAIWKLRTLAEETYHVRPYLFDSYVQVKYFHHSDPITSNRNERTGRVSYIRSEALHTVEILKDILERRRQIINWILYLSILLACILVYRNETSTDIAGQTARYMVYPGMRMWRRMTLPIIRRFPHLTEFHDEACLMENPFFQTEDLSCSYCTNVHTILNLSSNEEEMQYSIHRENFFDKIQVPFVFKSEQNSIQLDNFYEIYSQNYEVFQRDAYRVHSTNKDINNLDELFNQFNYTLENDDYSDNLLLSERQTHNLWRCNRMLPARILRKIFSQPRRLPSNGFALERFITIDSPRAPAYTLPGTECANVVIQQALGTRFIILRPTSECKHLCRTLSIRLSESTVLSYNWWYWKSISTPDPLSKTLSISLIGSYC